MKKKKAEKSYELNNVHLHHLKFHFFFFKLSPLNTQNYKPFYKQDLKNKSLVVINSFSGRK